MRKALFVLASILVLGGLSRTGYAANADHPYTNIDRSNDAGNDTGDSRVDDLNAMQLDENYRGPTYPQGTPPVPQTSAVPAR